MSLHCLCAGALERTAQERVCPLLKLSRSALDEAALGRMPKAVVHHLGEAGLIALAKGCPLLQTLNVRFCNLTEATMRGLAEGCPLLQSLNLTSKFIGLYSNFNILQIYSNLVQIYSKFTT